jgi:type IV pilus assembly protein PilA
MINKNKKGFTLIELLIVIGIIAILAGIVLVAVNPAQQFGKANDSERKSEIAMVLSAVYQYQTSPTARGALPVCETGAGDIAQDIPECGVEYIGAMELGTGDTEIDCTSALVASYLRELPIDPSSGYDAVASGYWICQDTSGTVSRVYVIAENAEVYTDDGGCSTPGDAAIDAAMCVSG